MEPVGGVHVCLCGIRDVSYDIQGLSEGEKWGLGSLLSLSDSLIHFLMEMKPICFLIEKERRREKQKKVEVKILL